MPSQSKSAEVPFPAYTFPDYDTPMPNPFGVIKKFPKKLVSATIRLLKLDKILLEIFVAVISVPDEKLQEFFEVKLRELAKRAEKPLREISENLATNVLEPLLAALPGVGFIKMLDKGSQLQESLNKSQESAGNVLREVIKEARELTSDVTGPARGLSSLILGLSEYLEKVKRGENVEEIYRIFEETGRSVNQAPEDEAKNKAAARLLSAEMINNITNRLREAEKGGFPMGADDLMKRYAKMVATIIDRETNDSQESQKGVFDHLMKLLMDYANEDGEGGEGEGISTDTETVAGTRKVRSRLRQKNKTRKNK